VLFTKDAQVNVGTLVASTLKMSNEDFLQSRYRLEGGSENAIVNQGVLKAKGGDGKGGSVALVAAKIINEGSITTPKGTVGLVAASKVVLDMGGPVRIQVEEGALNALIEQGGAIRAEGGRILMTAKAANELRTTVINHSGISVAASIDTNEAGEIVLAGGENGGVAVSGRLDVSSSVGKGGKVQITGSDILLKSGSSINASGAKGGGTVLVGGDWQGSGSLQQAKTVTMEQDAVIDASAVDVGDGGKVVLWSDIHNAESITAAKGLIKASAGINGGNGGQVETSGKILDVAGVAVLAGTTNGRSGFWLLDPDNLTIDAAGRTSITNSLNNGTSVEINTSSAASFGTTVNFTGATGDVIMRGGDISVSPSAAVNFTINASGGIVLGGNITSSSNSLNINIIPGTVNGTTKSIVFRDSSSWTTRGGNISLRGPVELWSDLTLNTSSVSGGGSVLFGSTIESLKLDTFTSSGNSTWVAPSNVTKVEVLLVGGGGGGGYDAGGGGGGGGVIYNTSYAVTAGTSYNVTVGAGGTGGVGYVNGTNITGATNEQKGVNGTIGGNTSFATLTAIGGGSGGGKGQAGGSGGANGGSGEKYISGTNSSLADYYAGAGGSGAGANGGAAVNYGNGTGKAGDGGIGSSNSITGITQIYGSGGGGGVYSSSSIAGNGSVGSAAGGNFTSNANAVPAADPLTASASYGGGGAGGGVVSAGHGNGTSGASGAVFIKYQYPNNLTINSGSGAVTFNGTVGNVGAIGNLSLSSANGTTTVNTSLVATTGSQTYSNPVTISQAATLRAASITTSSTMGASSNALTMTTDAVSIGGVLSGTSSLIIQPYTSSTTIGLNTGAGNLSLNATEISRLSGFSSITIGSTNGTGAINLTGTTSIGSSTTLRADSASINIGSSFSVTGNLTVNTTGTTTISGTNVNATGTETYTGAVALGASTALAATTVNTQSTISGGGYDLTVTGNSNVGAAITNLGNYSVTGTTTLGGNVSATGNQTYTGQVTLSGAARAITAGNNIALTGGAVSASALNLDMTATSGGVSSPGSIALTGGNLSITQGGNSTISGIISGSGSVTKAGSGTLILSGSNTFTGNVALNAGTLNLNSSSALGNNGTISFGGGALQFSSSNTNDYSSRFSTAASQQYKFDTNGQNVTLNTAMTSSGATLTKSGTGTLILTGNNTYSGLNTISAGVLQVGNGGASGWIVGNVANSGDLVFNLSSNHVIVNSTVSNAFTGYISGTGNLTKNGSGNLTLDAGGDFFAYPCYRTSLCNGVNVGSVAASSFTGDITINQGRLIGVNQRNANTLLAGNQTSSFGNPALGKTITINSGGTLVFGNNDVLDYSASTPNVTIVVNSGGLITNQQASDSSAQTGVFNALGNVTLNGGNISSIGGYNTSFRAFYLRGEVTATGNTTSYITQSGNDSSSGVQISSSSINVTSGSTLIVSTAFNDQPAATSSLTKSGAGELVLTGTNSFSGNLTITGGNVTLGDGGSTGSIPTSNTSATSISAGANFRFNLNSSINFNGSITGAGSVVQMGTGTTTITNNNTYTGGTTISNGTLNLGAASAIGPAGTRAANGNITFSGGTLQYSASNQVDYSGRFSTADSQQYKIDTNGQNITLASAMTSVGGSLTKSGSGNLILTGLNTFTGLTTVSSGSLIVGANGTSGALASNNVSLTGNIAFTRSDDITFSGNISGTGGFGKSGNGNLTLTGTNSYSGDTLIASGRLIVGD
jgi:autotransporter-associated beta strand protein